MEELRNHKVLRNIGWFTPEDFLGVLLQRRFISFAFTSIYDFAIDALQDKTSKVLAGRILRDEYPNGDAPLRSSFIRTSSTTARPVHSPRHQCFRQRIQID